MCNGHSWKETFLQVLPARKGAKGHDDDDDDSDSVDGKNWAGADVLIFWFKKIRMPFNVFWIWPSDESELKPLHLNCYLFPKVNKFLF